MAGLRGRVAGVKLGGRGQGRFTPHLGWSGHGLMELCTVQCCQPPKQVSLELFLYLSRICYFLVGLFEPTPSKNGQVSGRSLAGEGGHIPHQDCSAFTPLPTSPTTSVRRSILTPNPPIPSLPDP